MKPLISASIFGAAITATGCAGMSPAKDPDSLTLQVPLEQAPPSPKQQKNGEAIRQENPSIESQLIASARKDMSGICAEIEGGNSQCSGEVFREISTHEEDGEQMRILRSRCLAIIAECKKNDR